MLCVLCLGKQGLIDIPGASSESPVTWALRSHLSVLKAGAQRRGLIEIKASGEENGVTKKGRPCHPELTDLQMRVVQGPWQGSGEDREQIWVRLMFLTQPCYCEVSGL